MNICLWGSDSIYFKEHIKELKGEFEIISIANSAKENDIYDITLTTNNRLKFVSRRLNMLKILYLFLKYDNICDYHIIHNLHHEYATSLAYLPIKKPVICIPYGTEIVEPVGYNLPKGYLRWVVKRALQRADIIICFTKSFYKKYIVEQYCINENKILNLWPFPINPVFTRLDNNIIDKLREKWNIKSKYVILSPRAVKRMYNHHLVLDAISMLPIKNDITFVITGFGDDKTYREKIVRIANNKGIRLLDTNRFLNPKEMAELYNISSIAVNIPSVEDLGRSPFEAILCNSVTLLNKNSGPQREVFRDGKYCKFVELDVKNIADSIESILDNPEEYKDEVEYNRIKDIIDWNKNKRILVDCINNIKHS